MASLCKTLTSTNRLTAGEAGSLDSSLTVQMIVKNYRSNPTRLFSRWERWAGHSPLPSFFQTKSSSRNKINHHMHRRHVPIQAAAIAQLWSPRSSF